MLAEDVGKDCGVFHNTVCDLNFLFMLQITHNVRAPHDETFYKILGELTKVGSYQYHVDGFIACHFNESLDAQCNCSPVQECEELMAKGITGTGAGFDAKGHKVSTMAHNPPATHMRSAALRAAEARAQKQAGMFSGPRKLGTERR